MSINFEHPNSEEIKIRYRCSFDGLGHRMDIFRRNMNITSSFVLGNPVLRSMSY